jgi:hypothetical protein
MAFAPRIFWPPASRRTPPAPLVRMDCLSRIAALGLGFDLLPPAPVPAAWHGFAATCLPDATARNSDRPCARAATGFPHRPRSGNTTATPDLGRGTMLSQPEKNMQTQKRTEQAQAPPLLPQTRLLSSIQVDYARRRHGSFFGNTR